MSNDALEWPGLSSRDVEAVALVGFINEHRLEGISKYGYAVYLGMEQIQFA